MPNVSVEAPGGEAARPAEDLRKRLGWREAPSAETVGGWLRRLGFRRMPRDREGARYEVTAERLRDMTALYAADEAGA